MRCKRPLRERLRSIARPESGGRIFAAGYRDSGAVAAPHHLNSAHAALTLSGMAEPSTPLPPFAALRAFHAAAVHGRFRDAPASLGVTQ